MGSLPSILFWAGGGGGHRETRLHVKVQLPVYRTLISRAALVSTVNITSELNFLV